jgi:GntR family transcriptional regulator/MocR family aminotransferase
MFAVNLDTSSGTPLFQQLYEHIRDGILAGRLCAGTRLPASRTLAGDLGVSRTTVVNAFDQLRAEGYLRGRVGSGTRVVSMLPETAMRVAPPRAAIRQRLAHDRRLLQRMHGRWPDVMGTLTSSARPLRPGNPDVHNFPRELWARLTAKHWRTIDPALLGYSGAEGYLPLRAAIAGYVSRVRGVRCDAKQVLVVAGSQQALHLCAQVLLESGDVAWMEDPGYPGARDALMGAGARIVPKRVDGEGLVVASKNDPAGLKLIYVTPSHQCPLGVVMSVSRRLELLEFAARKHAWIVEDDYDSEYRYFSRPVAAVQSLDRSGRVIYIGTVSKTLLPALRIGYIIAPEFLFDVFTRARRAMDRQSAVIDQAVLAEFISEGWLERHIRQTRTRYLERQRALVDAIRAEMPDILEVAASEAGMYLVAYIRKPGLASSRAAHLAATHGVGAMPLSAFAQRPLAKEGLVLGYGEFGVEEIRDAVQKLSQALKNA